ncbi:hypothetical protein L915_15599 [Phytophthora nicotianae]|nr:hypothetical protein L915_15599 [Phytophthora nicotianae]
MVLVGASWKSNHLLVYTLEGIIFIRKRHCNRLVWHDVGTTVAGEIFQQDRWMIGSDEESSEPNKRVVDTQDRAQRNSEGSQTEKTRGHEEE